MKTNREAIILGAILILLQVADGFLTFRGLQLYGITMEANTFLRSLMIKFGHLEALVLAKVIAIAVIIRLVVLAKEHTWVKTAIGLSCFFYLFAAVIPWTYILSSN